MAQPHHGPSVAVVAVKDDGGSNALATPQVHRLAGAGSTLPAREHRTDDAFDFDDVDFGEVDEGELDNLLARYDTPSDLQSEGLLSSRSSLTPTASITPSKANEQPSGTRSDPIVLDSSSPRSFSALQPRPRALPSLKRSAPSETPRDSGDVPPRVKKPRTVPSPAKEKRTFPAPGKQQRPPQKRPEPRSNAKDEATVATINDLLAAVSVEVSDVPSAAELVASFDGSPSNVQQSVSNIIDPAHPLVLTRAALETMLAFAPEIVGTLTPLALLARLIVHGRLQHATTLVLHDFPGGSINVDNGEYFPADKTISLLNAAASASPVLCPKVTTVIVRQGAAEDLFDNSHISMEHLALLAAPTHICLDFDLSFTGSSDLNFNSTFGFGHDKLHDMSPERGVALGNMIRLAWPSVKGVSFHRGAGKSLPYCGIPVEHVVYCGSGRFDASVSLLKRRGALSVWKENAAENLFKELLRSETQRSTTRKKPTDIPMGSLAQVTSSPINRTSKGPTWATINPVWAAEEAEEEASSTVPTEATWIVRHRHDLKDSQRKLIDFLYDRVEHLIEAREKRGSVKIKSRLLKDVDLNWRKNKVSCRYCWTFW